MAKLKKDTPKPRVKKTTPAKKNAQLKKAGGQPNNKNAQKWTEERILEIVADCTEGLIEYASAEVKHRTRTGETKTTTRSGYSCIQRALLANRIFNESKLHEWRKTHKDNAVVSQAIDDLLEVGHNMILINTAEGHYSPQIGRFLCGAVLGMVDKGVEVTADAMKTFEGFEFVPIDETVQ